jgi:hypothetical protein
MDGRKLRLRRHQHALDVMPARWFEEMQRKPSLQRAATIFWSSVPRKRHERRASEIRIGSQGRATS